MMAAERLAILVAEAPTYAAAHVLRATALEAAGRVDEALVSWGRAAALVPRSPLVHRERERLLALHVAEAVPDLPPAEPDPEAVGLSEPPERSDIRHAPPVAPLDAIGAEDEPTPEPHDSARLGDSLEPAGEPAAVDEPADEPDSEPIDDPFADESVGFGSALTFDASELITGPLPMPEADAPDPDPEAPAPDDSVQDAPEADDPDPQPSADGFRMPPPPRAPQPDAFDWDEIDAARILPPETRPPVELPDLPDDDPFGWDVVAETDVPVPPPGSTVEPDVVAPEDAPEAPPDAFATDGLDVPFESAEPPPPAPEPPAATDELDALIAQLEVAPRIRPDPEYRGPEQPLDHPEVDSLASETLAKIYAAQHQYVEAAVVYEKLAAQRPAQAEALLQRAAELRRQGG